MPAQKFQNFHLPDTDLGASSRPQAFFNKGQAQVKQAPFFSKTPNRPFFQPTHSGSSGFPIQARLTVGPSNDKYEQEANRVASRVVNQIHAPGPIQSAQRQSIEPKEGTQEALQTKPILSLQQGISGEEMSPALAPTLSRARSGGKPLETGLQQSMGQLMGTDFSTVRVHTDGPSDQLNQSIQAKAFTTGRDVFFRKGAYQPQSLGGQELIAHELTHVVQQAGGTTRKGNASPENGAITSLSAEKGPVVQRWPLVQDGGFPYIVPDENHFYQLLEYLTENQNLLGLESLKQALWATETVPLGKRMSLTPLLDGRIDKEKSRAQNRAHGDAIAQGDPIKVVSDLIKSIHLQIRVYSKNSGNDEAALNKAYTLMVDLLNSPWINMKQNFQIQIVGKLHASYEAGQKQLVKKKVSERGQNKVGNLVGEFSKYYIEELKNLFIMPDAVTDEKWKDLEGSINLFWTTLFGITRKVGVKEMVRKKIAKKGLDARGNKKDKK